MEAVLKGIFKFLFNDEFDNSLGHEFLMQKSIYVLRCMGLDFEEYDFRCVDHGPFSYDLKADYRSITPDSTKDTIPGEVVFARAFERLNLARDVVLVEATALSDSVLNADDGWGLFWKGLDNEKKKHMVWLEAVSSLHYIENFMPRENLDPIDPIRILKDKKSWFAADNRFQEDDLPRALKRARSLSSEFIPSKSYN